MHRLIEEKGRFCMIKHVAIIGAGMAGLSAARQLKKKGFGITIFEKSRRVGGRMATRRVNGLQFDHGAQYFTAKGPQLQAMVGEWRESGRADQWFDGAFVGTPGMPAPARAMAEGHTIISECQVTALRHARGGWSVHDANGFIKTPGNGTFSGIILAVPAPQAVTLAETAAVDLPELERVRYAPCWALMLAFSGPLSLPDDRFKPQDHAISWIARNASKPGRAREHETFIIHATPDWSREHLEWSPDAAVAELTARFQVLTGIREQPYFSAAHRWRYALVEETARAAFLWDEDKRLGACGDWCLGPRVEAAFDSGHALAELVVRTWEVDVVA
jgi:renalase